MLAGLCHDLDHPGFNNNYLSLCKHPLSQMYKSSMLENHHYFLAKKVIEVIFVSRYIPPIAGYAEGTWQPTVKILRSH